MSSTGKYPPSGGWTRLVPEKIPRVPTPKPKPATAKAATNRELGPSKPEMPTAKGKGGDGIKRFTIVTNNQVGKSLYNRIVAIVDANKGYGTANEVMLTALADGLTSIENELSGETT